MINFFKSLFSILRIFFVIIKNFITLNFINYVCKLQI